MRYLSLRQAMIIAQAAVGPDVKVADPGLLASALARPAMSVFGDDAYPSLERKAAALMESLARNHTLVDGNKRLAWTSTVAFLRLNGFDLIYASVDEAEVVRPGRDGGPPATRRDRDVDRGKCPAPMTTVGVGRSSGGRQYPGRQKQEQEDDQDPDGAERPDPPAFQPVSLPHGDRRCDGQ